jgi:hypothetical protein
MSSREAYLYYEAGQAVAAVHLGLTIKRVSADAAREPTEIAVPRNHPKARMILWLTGMAAEKKAVGRSDPLRRTRTRQKIKAQVEAIAAELDGSSAKRQEESQSLMNQAQDRANAICAGLYEAIEAVAAKLREGGAVTEEEVREAVQVVKRRRSEAGKLEETGG